MWPGMAVWNWLGFGRVLVVSMRWGVLVVVVVVGGEPGVLAGARKTSTVRLKQSASVRRVEALVVDGMKRRGRPKLRSEDRVKLDMNELLLSDDITFDRNEWRAKIRLVG
ncbi:hypothetical protein Tco_0591125 [Tanacetum coccineum]